MKRFAPLFVSFGICTACSSSSGFVVAESESDAGGEASSDAGELDAAADASELDSPAKDTLAPSSDVTPEVMADTAVAPDGAPVDAPDAPECSSLAPSCCQTVKSTDLAACEAASVGATPGWTWFRTSNVAFRCAPPVEPPAAQPCASSYRLAAGALFCCVKGGT